MKIFKRIFFFVSLLLSNYIFAQKFFSDPSLCSGRPGKYVWNLTPNGLERGGFVARTAYVAKYFSFRHGRKVTKGYIGPNTQVCNHARVHNKAELHDNAKLLDHAMVYHSVIISGYAQIKNYAQIFDQVQITDHAIVSGHTVLSDQVTVSENAHIYGQAILFGQANIYGNAKIFQNANVSGSSTICEHAKVYGNADILEQASVYGYAEVFGSSVITRKAQVCEEAKIQDSVQITDEAIVYGQAHIKGAIIVAGFVKIFGKSFLWGNFILAGHQNIANTEDEDEDEDGDKQNHDSPTLSYNPQSTENFLIKENSGDTCCICLDHFKKNESAIKLKNCGHFFHSECFTAWQNSEYNKENCCPFCKQ